MSTTMIGAGIFTAAGCYFILSDLMRMPTLEATRAAIKLTQNQKARGYHALLRQWAGTLAKYIRLDEYRRRQMTATLKYAGIELSPEAYLSDIIVKTAVRLLLIIPCIWISPLLIPVVILLTINKCWDSIRAAEKIAADKRKSIERELPRFVATIAQEISATRDVLSLLEGYRETAGPVFKNELEITIADMKSGSQEQALNHLSGRVGSGMLSEVVRGLLTVLNGSDGVILFAMLNHDYQKLEIQALRKEAQKRPGKLKKYSYLLLACIIGTYLFVVFKQVGSYLGTLF